VKFKLFSRQKKLHFLIHTTFFPEKRTKIKEIDKFEITSGFDNQINSKILFDFFYFIFFLIHLHPNDYD